MILLNVANVIKVSNMMLSNVPLLMKTCCHDNNIMMSYSTMVALQSQSFSRQIRPKNGLKTCNICYNIAIEIRYLCTSPASQVYQ